MKKLFKETEQNIRKIRGLVEDGKLNDEDLYPLDSFRYNPDFISDLINELDETSSSFKKAV